MRRLSGHVLKISMALKRFNPEKYDPKVLLINKKEWTGEVCQAVSDLIDQAGEILADDITDEETDAIHEITETQNDLCQEFLAKYHHKMLGVTRAAEMEEDVITAGGDVVAALLSTQDGIIANHRTAAAAECDLVPDKGSDGDIAAMFSGDTLVTEVGAGHVSVLCDTEDMTELVVGKMPSHSYHDFYLALDSGESTNSPGMKMILNLVEQVPVLSYVPVIAQILGSTMTLSGHNVPVLAMTQSQCGVKAGVDSGGGNLCLMSVTWSAGGG